VAEAALADTLQAVARCSADRLILALDGAPGPWLPDGFEVVAQRGGSFDERLANAWTDADGDGLQIGMDTPQLSPATLDRLLAALDGPGRRAVLGPAHDGGWWVIGLRGADPRPVFTGVPMSTAATGEAQERRLRALGFDVTIGPELRDIDTWDDLLAVAAVAEATRTAALVRRLLRGGAPADVDADADADEGVA